MIKYGSVFLLISVIILSCRKKEVYTDPSARLDFSTDSIAFDTVFSRFDTNNAPLSTTKILKIYNPYKSCLLERFYNARYGRLRSHRYSACILKMLRQSFICGRQYPIYNQW